MKSRSVSACPAYAPEVKHAGAEYVGVGWAEADVDGNLATRSGWTAQPTWLAKFPEVIERLVTATLRVSTQIGKDEVNRLSSRWR